MTSLEVVLLISALILIIVSYVISERIFGIKGSASIKEEDIKNLLAKEIETIKTSIENDLEETADTTLEHTNRNLEKVSNEKIMAVNEYSDTVLEEIKKSHKEIVFLYSMLNDKEEKLKGIVAGVDKTKIEVESLILEAEKKVIGHKPEIDSKIQEIKEQKNEEIVTSQLESKESDIVTKEANHNKIIMELHQQGISKTDIARQLGLGQGEVQLVIDLFKGE